MLGVERRSRSPASASRSYFFLRNRARRPTRWPSASPACARLLLNKYYVDEIYDAAIVQPIRIVSEEGLWKVVDVRVIDGAVNGVGERRRLQRGAAPPADRIGARLRGVAVARGRADPGVLPVALITHKDTRSR